MCFEMSFGKYQLKGKKSNSVESFLCMNGAYTMFYTDTSSLKSVCCFPLRLERDHQKCFAGVWNSLLCFADEAVFLHALVVFICTEYFEECNLNWDYSLYIIIQVYIGSFQQLLAVHQWLIHTWQHRAGWTLLVLTILWCVNSYEFDFIARN